MTTAADPTSSAPAPTPARVVSPYNPANAVTASRFLFLPPFLWAVSNGYHQWATLFIIVCGTLDKVDGLVAKIFDCRSAFGEMFDAITDGICYGFCLIVVGVYGWAPALPVTLILGMGVVNTVLRSVYIKRAGRTINYKSYAMERVVAYTGYLIGFATGEMEVQYFFWLYIPVMGLVVLHDAKRMLVDPIPGASA
ncbi:MAG: CDP-alcohol phosphatidyltransferase family protein [Kofleriaceae bacterium]